MITGISHITFVVKDVKRTAGLMKEILGAVEVYSRADSSGETVKYLLINDLWIALNKGEPLPERTYNHVAFKISEDDIEMYTEKIKHAGLEIKPERPGRVRTAGEGRSIYFYDFDNHLFELHTGTLENRLQAYSNYL